MTTITKLKNALAALEELSRLGNGGKPGNSIGNSIAQRALPDLRSVIAEMEAGEPMAYGYGDTQLGRQHRLMMVRLDKGQDGCTIPLYTHPQPKAEPVQCLDCGSNNVGVPANYDSVVTSVVNQKMTAEESPIIGYATHHEEPMLFPTKEEALQYCDFEEEPIALYAAPQAKPLTDDRIWELAANCLDSHFGRLNFARAIEAAHGIGGGK